MINEMHASGYRFIGRHSAIKVCNWTRQALRGNDTCYKCKFYGIASHKCIQMTPVVFWCNFNCPHCWRQHRYTLPPEGVKWDSPRFILNECIKKHVKLLQGFWGTGNADKKLVMESMKPRHVAISLAGEPTIYPYLPEFIDEILGKDMTAYLVTNGTKPDMIRKLINHEPTNLYISLYGPDKETYKKTTAWISDYWNEIMKSLLLFKKFSCNTVIRLTLTKGLNMIHPEKYAELIEKNKPRFVETKGFMHVGGAQQRLTRNAMPLHQEIMNFAKIIEEHSSYKIINEKENSSVVLLSQ